MAIADFVHGTPRMIDYTPGSAVTAGVPYVQGNAVRVPHSDIASGALGAAAIGGGIYNVDKDASTFADGDVCYWDAATSKVTSTSSGNKRFGSCVQAAATGVTKVRCLHICN